MALSLFSFSSQLTAEHVGAETNEKKIIYTQISHFQLQVNKTNNVMLLPFVDSVVQDLPTSRAQSITLCVGYCAQTENKLQMLEGF